MIDRATLETLADQFTDAHPRFDARQQQTALTVFRLLGEGRPVDLDAVAARTGRPPRQVAADLDAWPSVHRDGDGRVVGLWGLTLRPTAHALDVDGHTLYTWCALDALFVPELVGRPARVRSTSPTSGQTVTLTVDDDGPHGITPSSAVMTLRRVTAGFVDAWRGVGESTTVDSFCCYVHFFADEDEARAWVGGDDNTLVASIADGFAYGRRYNHRQFGAALQRATA